MNTPGYFASKFQKCQCCNNPWNRSEDDTGSNESAVISCRNCLEDDKGIKGINPANFDNSILPSDNFYLWSNGGWRKNNPIPAEYPSWNTFMALRDMNLDRLKSILEDLQSGKIETSNESKKLSDFYNTMMDEETIEGLGISILLPLVHICKNSLVDPIKTISILHAEYGIRPFFGIYSCPDKKNSDHTICTITQGGLGMPDRDYYLEVDKAEKRNFYVDYITKLFTLLGTSGLVEYAVEDQNRLIATDILKFETEIAKSHLSRTTMRDPEITFNKMPIAHVTELSTPPITWESYLAYGVNTPSLFDWSLYFNFIGKSAEDMGEINVATVEAIGKIGQIVKRFPKILPHYLLFHVVNSVAPHLPREFVTTHFEFHEKSLKGTQEMRPRWKRCLETLEDALGEALGKIYVTRHFPAQAKAEAVRIVELVRDALRERLGEVQWMSDETRAEALRKMERFRVKIGFPDNWIDYTELNVVKGSHLQNVFAARRFAFDLDLRRMNAATDRSRWLMTPQTVNAYYHPMLNEVVFPAAILQPPFFDSEADEAVKFGSMGAVVGHEMTHGFDDMGRKYDSSGNIRDWWVGGDGAEYERRASFMIKQAEKFEVHGVKLNGKLTCGENVADLGGLKLAFRALKAQLANTANPQREFISGFTPEQRFFLAWSQAWRENIKKERALQLVTLDPHGPNELRCNGPLSNMAEFLEAFKIVEGDPMYKPPEDRVDIW